MRLYRIVKTKFLATAWSGYGAQQFGGRWNHPGHAVVYTSSSVSLAILEVLVHLQNSQILSHYSLLSIDVPDEQIKALSKKALPKFWNQYPAQDESMDVGDNWLVKGKTIGLKVPSVVVPSEYNVLLNPLHADFNKCLATVTKSDAYFDPRLYNK